MISHAFLLDDFLSTNLFFGANQIIITSASSKTAIALAHLTHIQRKTEATIKIIGLTSKSNIEFLTSLGCFDRLVLYDDVKNLPIDNSAIVDFSGNQNLLNELKAVLNDHLKYISLVGITKKEESKIPPEGLQGTVFFAPTQMKLRSKEWGQAKLQENLTSAWLSFMPFVMGWLKIKLITEPDGLSKLYLENLNGQVPANSAYVVGNS